MTPIKFPQATTVLLPPPNIEEECSELYVHFEHNNIVSCWRPTFWERIAIFMGARVWLWVASPIEGHPPVALEVQNPF